MNIPDFYLGNRLILCFMYYNMLYVLFLYILLSLIWDTIDKTSSWYLYAMSEGNE